jgi:hypothetical protein
MISLWVSVYFFEDAETKPKLIQLHFVKDVLIAVRLLEAAARFAGFEPGHIVQS